MPWVPRVQSRGSEAEVKFVRRVMELERLGSSEWLIGGKRWSSNALYVSRIDGQPVCRYCYLYVLRSWTGVTYAVKAYTLNPDPSSCASNVPMHPRRLLFPLRGDILFHVTNKGCSSSLGGAAGDDCCERRLPKLKKEVLEEDFDVLSKVTLEDVVEREDGVEEDEEAEAGEGACRRDMLGRESFEGVGWASSCRGSSSSPSSSSSLSSTPSISLSSSWSSVSCTLESS